MSFSQGAAVSGQLNGSATTDTIPLTPTAVGSLVTMAFSFDSYSSGIVTLTATNLTSISQVILAGTAGAQSVEMWMGISTATSAGTITVTYGTNSGGTSGNGYLVQEYLGASSWPVAASAGLATSTGFMPSVTSTGDNLYVGVMNTVSGGPFSFSPAPVSATSYGWWQASNGSTVYAVEPVYYQPAAGAFAPSYTVNGAVAQSISVLFAHVPVLTSRIVMMV